MVPLTPPICFFASENQAKHTQTCFYYIQVLTVSLPSQICCGIIPIYLSSFLQNKDITWDFIGAYRQQINRKQTKKKIPIWPGLAHRWQRLYRKTPTQKNMVCGGDFRLGALLGPTGTIRDTVPPNHCAALTNALLLFLLFYDFCRAEETFQTLITSPTERQRATLQIIQRVNSVRQDCTVSATAPMSTHCSTASCLHIFVILQIHFSWEYQVCSRTHFFP